MLPFPSNYCGFGGYHPNDPTHAAFPYQVTSDDWFGVEVLVGPAGASPLEFQGPVQKRVACIC